MMRITETILVVEDELITADLICDILIEEGFNILGPVKSAAAAIAVCEKSSVLPDVALCDIHIKDNETGIALAQTLQARFYCEIVFLTAFSDAATLKSAFALKPVMYITKPFSETQLLVAIRMAIFQLMQQRTGKPNGSTLSLTERERDIIALIQNGFSSKQIAHRLNISVDTVKTHRKRMLQKNNLNSISQLVYFLHHIA
jgi:DNA-binding NarL/FixJ family response regulator